MHKDDPLSNLPSVENMDSSAVPSNSATGDFTADADQQGIFSSNDTRVETENFPEIPEVVHQAPASSTFFSTPHRVHHDRGFEIEQCSDEKEVAAGCAGGGRGGGNRSGDMVIKLLISNSNMFTSQEKTAYGVTEESKRLFNRYVNFLLDDNDTSDKPNLLDFLANDYTFLSPEAMFAEKIKLDSDLDSARAYFNDLNALYGEFSQKFFSPDADPDEESEGYSRNSASNYFFEAAKGSFLNLSQIVSSYIQDGAYFYRRA